MKSEPAPAAEPQADEAAATSFLQRAPLRRRLRYLRRYRQVALRDLGSLVYESSRDGAAQPQPIAEQVAALSRLDAELDSLERALAERRELLALREPGLAACEHCATIHGSDARYCPQCGGRVGGPAQRKR